MTIEEIKQFVRDNQKGLIVGCAVGFLIRSLMR